MAPVARSTTALPNGEGVRKGTLRTQAIPAFGTLMWHKVMTDRKLRVVIDSHYILTSNIHIYRISISKHDTSIHKKKNLLTPPPIHAFSIPAIKMDYWRAICTISCPNPFVRVWRFLKYSGKISMARYLLQPLCLFTSGLLTALLGTGAESLFLKKRRNQLSSPN